MLTSGVTFRPATLGDWDTTVWTYAGSYQRTGNSFGFVYHVSGTPSFTAAASGNLQVVGWPFAFATNVNLIVTSLVGFSSWDATTIGVHLSMGGTTGTMDIDRRGTTGAHLATTNITSGVPLSFTVAGSGQLA